MPGQDEKQSLSFAGFFEKEAYCLHIVIINLWCFKYFYLMFMLSMRIVSDSLPYCIIYTVQGKVFNKNTENEHTNNKTTVNKKMKEVNTTI